MLDVLFIGPVFFWGGRRLADKEPIYGGLLMTLGALTVIYNGANYLTMAERKRAHVGAPLLFEDLY